MNKKWQQYLKTQGAVVDYAGVHDFGHLQRELEYALTELCLIDLSHFGIIQISGPDAQKFLQGQLTCDLTAMDQERTMLSACCDHKGRMIANFCIWQEKQDYYLLLPLQMVQLLLTHLQKYAAFSKVALKNLSENWHVIGLCGAEMQDRLKQLNHHKRLFVRRYASQAIPQTLFIGSTENIMKTWEMLNPHAKKIGYAAWNFLNIEMGIVFIYPETSALFIPQMINLQQFNGVSFTKGCYVGQEVIARMEHLGKLKRHLYRLHANTKVLPQPGDSIIAHDQSMGVVVMATPNANQGYRVLAVIEDRAAHQSIFIQQANQGMVTEILRMDVS